MIWEPFAMALVLGLLMSAGLYFAYLWPSVEPDEEEVGAPEAAKAEAKPEVITEPAKPEPATATVDKVPEPAKTEPATEEPETPPPSVAETKPSDKSTAKTDDETDA